MAYTRVSTGNSVSFLQVLALHRNTSRLKVSAYKEFDFSLFYGYMRIYAGILSLREVKMRTKKIRLFQVT